MSERLIPLIDIRSKTLPMPTFPPATARPGKLLDALQRPLHDLRISVTDRCNFRCSYCMPKSIFDKNHAYLPQGDLLSFEEITRLARQFIAQGVKKIRLTGGEPLLRKNIESLVGQLARLQTLDGQPLDLTLTTNGSLLARKAQALRDAGLQRVTVSLDSLNDATFRAMNDMDFPLADVMDGIETAQAVGLGPIKINMVVKRGTNEDDILPMARHFRHSGVVLRFIEYMDVGATNGWRMDEVLPSHEVIRRIHAELPLEPASPHAIGETAERWKYKDGAGEIGVISSVTQAFCQDCTRARLSTDGRLYLCLFATQGYDLRSMLRNNASDDELLAAISNIWAHRTDRYSLLRASMPADLGMPASKRIEMSYIGG